MICESQTLTPEQVIFWVKKRKLLDSQIILSDDDNIKSRQEWTRAARKRFHPGEQKPCAVCGKYSSITHAHHVAPLALQFEYRIIIPIQDFVWLCPTHHELVHAVINSLQSSNVTSLLDITQDIESDELDSLLQIARIGIKKLKEKK